MREQETLTPDEKAVVEAGLYIHDVLHKLRSRLSFVQRRDISSSYKKVIILTLSNRDCFQAELDIEEKSKGLTQEYGLLPMDALAAEKMSLPAGKFTADEISESVNDTCEALLKFISDDDSQVDESATCDYQDVAADLNVAAAYRATEDLWSDVIWRSFRMEESDHGVKFVTTDVEGETLREKSLCHCLRTWSRFLWSSSITLWVRDRSLTASQSSTFVLSRCTSREHSLALGLWVLTAPSSRVQSWIFTMHPSKQVRGLLCISASRPSIPTWTVQFDLGRLIYM